MDQPILVGEFPAKAFETGNGGDLPNGASTEDLVEYLYTSGYAGGFTWAYIQDEFNSHPDLMEDVLVRNTLQDTNDLFKLFRLDLGNCMGELTMGRLMYK